MQGCMWMHGQYAHMCSCAYVATHRSDTHKHAHTQAQRGRAPTSARARTHLSIILSYDPHRPVYCLCLLQIRISRFVHVSTPVRALGTCVCVWLDAHVSAPLTSTPRRCRPSRSSGSQAFDWTSAFNADISKWNTAAVTSMYSVRAASASAARNTADALGR